MSEEPQTPSKKTHASCCLSKKQEENVLKYCLQYLDCGHVSLKGCAGRIGNALYHKPKKQSKLYRAKPLNKNWGSTFCSRCPELKIAIEKGQLSARLNVKASAADFKVRLAKCIEEYNIQPENMYAVKEWGFITTKYAEHQKMTLHRPSNPDHEPRNLTSTILCISRKGKFLTPYLINKGKKSAGFEKKSRVWLGSNPNGWADKFDFAKWYEYFESKTRGGSNRESRPWRLLLVEGHRSPVTEQCFVRALKRKIIIFSYPRHKDSQLDPFCCGVLDYLERRFVEWLSPRWEERSTRGEEIVEIESLDLAATVSWLTVAGKKDSTLKVERETEIRTAWVKCNQNWIRGGDSSASKEIKSTVVKEEKWDKKSIEDHSEGERTGLLNEFLIHNKTGDSSSIQTQTTKLGPSQPTPVDVICLDSGSDLPNDSAKSANRGHKRSWSKAIRTTSEPQNGGRTGIQPKKHQSINQPQATCKLHLDLKVSPTLELPLSCRFHLSGELRLGPKPLLSGEVHLDRQHPLSHNGVLNQGLPLDGELCLRKILSFDSKLHVNQKLLLSYKVILSRAFTLNGKSRLGRELALSLEVHLNRKLSLDREHPFKVQLPRSGTVHISSEFPFSSNPPLKSKFHIGNEPGIRQTLPPNHEI
ncbi:uncharacterized protein N7483_008276 [Penicillium malachiteum]|uniref:uncharacterized protein n=1 Tax=Penicillium malachiteum TaxID=1324776 RepID=UPI002547D9EB|nr:uncharacterized protein N7483_008276 [Penicillium malachiteum]KAJ5720342.1 hypothetical protein N7483_008276 [Penicillium malachiteum]